MLVERVAENGNYVVTITCDHRCSESCTVYGLDQNSCYRLLFGIGWMVYRDKQLCKKHSKGELARLERRAGRMLSA
jgi:hypothetical protein